MKKKNYIPAIFAITALLLWVLPAHFLQANIVLFDEMFVRGNGKPEIESMRARNTGPMRPRFNSAARARMGVCQR